MDAPGVDRVRVLWVAKGLGPGGMEQLLLNHATVGDRSRLAYEAAYVVDRPNSIVPQLESVGVSCHRLGSGDPRDPRWTVELARLVRRHRIDVVHVHSPYVAALARPTLRARRHRPAIVYTEHNSLDCYGRATRWGDVATYPLDDARFAVSEAARSSAPRWSRSRTEVLVHGIDVDAVAGASRERASSRARLGVEEHEVLIGVVANLRAAKAYPVMLRAARQVLDELPHVRFVSLGQGPLEAELRSLRDELGLGDRFEFLGFTPDAPSTMAAFDVFALSSDVEGLPVSVMEAKALGLPVVATTVGGLPEMVDSGVDGVLVPRRDPAALADALRRLVSDEALRRRMAEASGRGAARYDASEAVRRLDRCYVELAGGPGPRQT